jgi:hypothetical protein
VLGDLQEGRHRREQVGHDLLDDRHERAPLRQLSEFLERAVDSAFVTYIAGAWRPRA